MGQSIGIAVALTAAGTAVIVLLLRNHILVWYYVRRLRASAADPGASGDHEAIAALTGIGKPAIPALMDCLVETDPYRYDAAMVLAGIGETREELAAANVLLEGIEQHSRVEEDVVAQLFSWINHREAFRVLLDKGAPDVASQNAARSAWGRALMESRFLDESPASAADILVDITVKGDAMHRDAAVCLLHEIGRESMLGMETRIRYHLSILATRADEMPFSPLGARVPESKRRSYLSLISIGAPAIPPLQENLKSGSRNEKIYAILILSAFGTQGNDFLYDEIRKLFDDSDLVVRLHAVAAARVRFYKACMNELLTVALNATGEIRRLATTAFRAFTFTPPDATIEEARNAWHATRAMPDPELAVALIDRAIASIALPDHVLRAVARSYLRRATDAPIADESLESPAGRKHAAQAWSAWWQQEKATFRPRRNTWP